MDITSKQGKSQQDSIHGKFAMWSNFLTLHMTKLCQISWMYFSFCGTYLPTISPLSPSHHSPLSHLPLCNHCHCYSGTIRHLGNYSFSSFPSFPSFSSFLTWVTRRQLSNYSFSSFLSLPSSSFFFPTWVTQRHAGVNLKRDGHLIQVKWELPLLTRVWHFCFETSRYQNFSNDIEKIIRFGFGKFFKRRRASDSS